MSLYKSCLSEEDMLFQKKKSSNHGYPKARRGKIVSKSTKHLWINMVPYEENILHYEFFLNNSEIEHNNIIFTEKESIIIELISDEFFKIKDKQNLAKRLKAIVLETFRLNTFTDDEEIDETYRLILDELEKTGMEYSIDINKPGKFFPTTINEIPRDNFYYSLTCSYKMKDSEPFTYISEKAKTSMDFYIETNKAYNNGSFDMDENPDMIYLNIWNKIDGYMKKETLYQNDKKTGEPNKNFAEVIEILQASEFEKFETKYAINKAISISF
ncbi:hypothetical protein [Hungatella hathewayi]|uniref:hypothetical protein n=1 Tax=Hungatella hathewayi TaxID=154046 RepID=UPI00356B5B21